ncbi:MAG: hypothetical protein GKR94_02355 [Gammaproteobacteria bacterium]|nr:hypothetical protein [Gammaproteobacteria bacterium]
MPAGARCRANGEFGLGQSGYRIRHGHAKRLRVR